MQNTERIINTVSNGLSSQTTDSAFHSERLKTENVGFSNSFQIGTAGLAICISGRFLEIEGIILQKLLLRQFSFPPLS